MKRYSNRQSGQLLLIIVLLLATVVTIVLTVSFTSRTETQVSKLEEENQKALAAAEAGIDAALKAPFGSSIAIGSLPNLSDYLTEKSQAVVGPYPVDSRTFVSPSIQKDQIYTLYLSDYSTGDFTDPPYDSTLAFYYGNSSTADCNNLALSMTIISQTDSGHSLTRWVSDKTNKLQGEPGAKNIWGTSGNFNIEGEPFYCRTTTNEPLPRGAEKPRVMIVRSLFGQSRIGFEVTSADTTLDIIYQGKIITSTAQSAKTSVTKTVQLFQSFPQFPAEFFLTSF